MYIFFRGGVIQKGKSNGPDRWGKISQSWSENGQGGFLSPVDLPCNVIEDHQGDGAFSHIMQ